MRAINNLIDPDLKVSLAVDCRSELDLRIGAAFTRYQTLTLQPMYRVLSNVISYGSCQFPTLGFVVERWRANKDFVSENYWKLELEHKLAENNTTFLWKRVKLFNHETVLALQNLCLACVPAKVTNVTKRQKSRWRPIAMDTILMEKMANQKLSFSAQKTMQIAEKLYNKGYLSYPRTETNMFPVTLNLRNLVEIQKNSSQEFSNFCDKILNTWGGPKPRNGSKNDKAHPPIHPTKNSDSGLNGEEKRLYDLIARHFLACVSQDAKGNETAVQVELAGENFHAEGLVITHKNYLDIYPFERWNNKTIGNYERNEMFVPDKVSVISGKTQAPPLLNESDLISLMDKHGIGTDATHADHIEKIKERKYVGMKNNKFFIPTMLVLRAEKAQNRAVNHWDKALEPRQGA